MFNNFFSRLPHSTHTLFSNTFSVKTERGFHFYFWTNERIRQTRNEALKLDIKTKSLIVAPPSLKHSQVEYTICNNNPILLLSNPLAQLSILNLSFDNAKQQKKQKRNGSKGVVVENYTKSPKQPSFIPNGLWQSFHYGKPLVLNELKRIHHNAKGTTRSEEDYWVIFQLIQQGFNENRILDFFSTNRFPDFLKDEHYLLRTIEAVKDNNEKYKTPIFRKEQEQGNLFNIPTASQEYSILLGKLCLKLPFVLSKGQPHTKEEEQQNIKKEDTTAKTILFQLLLKHIYHPTEYEFQLSERYLAIKTGVSFPMVSQALDLLVMNDLISRRQRKSLIALNKGKLEEFLRGITPPSHEKLANLFSQRVLMKGNHDIFKQPIKKTNIGGQKALSCIRFLALNGETNIDAFPRYIKQVFNKLATFCIVSLNERGILSFNEDTDFEALTTQLGLNGLAERDAKTLLRQSEEFKENYNTLDLGRYHQEGFIREKTGLEKLLSKAIERAKDNSLDKVMEG
jgi:hypothetical protein